MMHPEMDSIRCFIVRGGTSKAVFLMDNDLPRDKQRRDTVIRAVFGSPDVRQIDGLGGADVLTSKLAIIAPPSRSDADVDYTFAQVSFDTDVVDFNSNCGNISSAVGPFAIDTGLVRAVEPVTTVRIHQTNTGKLLVAEVPVKSGKSAVEGDLHIDGVPGRGAKITLDFSDMTGSLTGKLLPTGSVADTVRLADGRKLSFSVVDVAIPVVFVAAGDLGLQGTETPQTIESNAGLMSTLEEIRGRVAQNIGLASKWDQAVQMSPYTPFIAMISPPVDYRTFTGVEVAAAEIDVVSRLVFMQRMHKTYPGTGTVCTGVAAKVPGSVVWNAVPERARDKTTLRIGHPAGTIPVEVKVVNQGPDVNLQRAAIYRTARMIMEGQVYVRKSISRGETS
jgi:2-methylaconitate cis-trans-isomerase PrpF